MKTDDNRLTIDVSRVDPDGDDLEGEIDCIDLEEDLVRPFGGVRYRLKAQVFGAELLVRGALEQDFTLVCSRCGEDFDTTVKVTDFTAAFEVSDEAAEIDVTDELREAIILELPNYPLCDENCPGVELETARPADGRWDALDALK